MTTTASPSSCSPPSSSSPRVGDTFDVYVTTLNIGNSGALPSATQLWHNNGFATFGVPYLLAGQYSYNATTYTCNQSGTIYFSANADSFDNVSEVNEYNNFRQETLYCAPAALPDLTTRISFNNSQPRVGDTIEINVTTSNSGSVYAGESWTRYFSYRIGGPGGGFAFPVPALQSGEQHSQLLSFVCTSPSTQVFNSTADWYGNVSESNESNNGFQTALDCLPSNQSLPDLRITDLAFRFVAQNGSSKLYEINATVANEGSAAASSFTDMLDYGDFSGQGYFAVPGGLLPGDSLVHTAWHWYSTNSSIYSVMGYADQLHEVQESNEDNNWRIEQLYP